MKVVLVLSYNNRWVVIVTIHTRYTVCYAPYRPQAKLFFWQETYLPYMAWLPLYFIQSEVSIHATCSKPDLLQNRFERGYLNAQHRFSTRFGEILQNKLYVFLECLLWISLQYRALTSVILYFPCSDLVLTTRFIHRGFYWRIKMWVKISGWSAWKTIRCHKINSVSNITRQDTWD